MSQVYVCEICGGTFVGRPVVIDLGGYKATVCPSCARKIRASRRAAAKGGERVPLSRRPVRAPLAEAPERMRPLKGAGAKPKVEAPKPRKRVRREPGPGEFTLVENYGQVLRRARQELGLTVEWVAEAANIKASLLRNIEAQKIAPSYRVARALERILEVKIITRGPPPEEEAPSYAPPQPDRPLTLGEVLNIKKKGEKGKKGVG